jgi:hypothetical protein
MDSGLRDGYQWQRDGIDGRGEMVADWEFGDCHGFFDFREY